MQNNAVGLYDDGTNQVYNFIDQSTRSYIDCKCDAMLEDDDYSNPITVNFIFLGSKSVGYIENGMMCNANIAFASSRLDQYITLSKDTSQLTKRQYKATKIKSGIVNDVYALNNNYVSRVPIKSDIIDKDISERLKSMQMNVDNMYGKEMELKKKPQIQQSQQTQPQQSGIQIQLPQNRQTQNQQTQSQQSAPQVQRRNETKQPALVFTFATAPNKAQLALNGQPQAQSQQLSKIVNEDNGTEAFKIGYVKYIVDEIKKTSLSIGFNENLFRGVLKLFITYTDDTVQQNSQANTERTSIKNDMIDKLIFYEHRLNALKQCADDVLSSIPKDKQDIFKTYIYALAMNKCMYEYFVTHDTLVCEKIKNMFSNYKIELSDELSNKLKDVVVTGKDNEQNANSKFVERLKTMIDKTKVDETNKNTN